MKRCGRRNILWGEGIHLYIIIHNAYITACMGSSHQGASETSVFTHAHIKRPLLDMHDYLYTYITVHSGAARYIIKQLYFIWTCRSLYSSVVIVSTCECVRTYRYISERDTVCTHKQKEDIRFPCGKKQSLTRNKIRTTAMKIK